MAKDSQQPADDLGLLNARPTPPKDPNTGRFVSPTQPTETVRIEEAPAEEPQVKPQHPQHLRDAAAYFGLDDSDLDAMTPQQANNLLWKLNNQNMKRWREEATQRTIQESQVRVHPAVEAPNHDDFSEFQGIDLGKDPETGEQYELRHLSPALLRLLKQTRAKDLAKIEALEARENQRQQMSNTEILDDAFESLGADFEAVFGAGSGVVMNQADPNFKRRRAVIIESGITDKDPPRVKKQKIIAAAKEMFGGMAQKPKAEEANGYDKIPGAKPGKTNGRVTAVAPTQRAPVIRDEDWDDAGLMPPSNRDVDDLPEGDEKAVRNLAHKLNTPTYHAEDAKIREGLLK